MADPIDLANPEPNSPEWWLRVLSAALDVEYPAMQTWNAYYENEHPLRFFDDAVRARFGHRFARFAANFAALVVDGEAERFVVQGFAFDDDPNGSDDVWALWQDNAMDAWSQSAHIDALIKGRAYAMVDPNAGDPRITVEDAMHTIVALDPRDNRHRLAGLKRWIEPSTGRLVVVIYLPDRVYKYRSVRAWPSIFTQWAQTGLAYTGTVAPDASAGAIDVPAGGFEPYQPTGDADWPLTNPLGVVPLVRLANRPRLSGKHSDGRSEIEPIASNQDLINYYRAMAAVGARYMALPQRYAINFEPEIDAATGQPKAPFQGGLADLWTVPPMDDDDPRALQAANQTSFGQFASADLQPFLNLIAWEVGAMASIARMPYWMLLGGQQGSQPPSGEAQTSSESAFMRKVAQQAVFFGDGWEEVMRVALRAMSDPRAENMAAETIWAPTGSINLAVRTDAIVKQTESDIIDRTQAQIELGYSPQTRKRIEASIAAEPPDSASTSTSPEDSIAGGTGIPGDTAVNGAGGAQQAVGATLARGMNGAA